MQWQPLHQVSPLLSRPISCVCSPASELQTGSLWGLTSDHWENSIGVRQGDHVITIMSPPVQDLFRVLADSTLRTQSASSCGSLGLHGCHWVVLLGCVHALPSSGRPPIRPSEARSPSLFLLPCRARPQQPSTRRSFAVCNDVPELSEIPPYSSEIVSARLFSRFEKGQESHSLERPVAASRPLKCRGHIIL